MDTFVLILDIKTTSLLFLVGQSWYGAILDNT